MPLKNVSARFSRVACRQIVRHAEAAADKMEHRAFPHRDGKTSALKVTNPARTTTAVRIFVHQDFRRFGSANKPRQRQQSGYKTERASPR
jgi:hypothetical protein